MVEPIQRYEKALPNELADSNEKYRHSKIVNLFNVGSTVTAMRSSVKASYGSWFRGAGIAFVFQR